MSLANVIWYDVRNQIRLCDIEYCTFNALQYQRVSQNGGVHKNQNRNFSTAHQYQNSNFSTAHKYQNRNNPNFSTAFKYQNRNFSTVFATILLVI